MIMFEYIKKTFILGLDGGFRDTGVNGLKNADSFFGLATMTFCAGPVPKVNDKLVGYGNE